MLSRGMVVETLVPLEATQTTRYPIKFADDIVDVTAPAGVRGRVFVAWNKGSKFEGQCNIKVPGYCGVIRCAPGTWRLVEDDGTIPSVEKMHEMDDLWQVMVENQEIFRQCEAAGTST